MKRMSVLVENFLHFFEIIWRRNNDAAFAHDRLGDECGHVAGSGEANYFVNGFGALPSAFFGIFGPLRTIGVRRGSEGYAGSIRAAAFFASLVAGNAQRAPAASVKAGMERDELVLAGVEAGQLHGTFDGFGAAVAKKSFGQSTRSNVGDLFGQIGDRLHMINVRRAVDQFVHLRFGGGDHLRDCCAPH